METIYFSGLSVIAAVVLLLVQRYRTKDLKLNLQSLTAQVGEAARQVHLKESEYLAERNKTEIRHGEALKKARQDAFAEGRMHGKTEYELAIATQLANQRIDFSERLQKEKEISAIEARDKQRAENELQGKLFSVKISPYLQILTDKGLIYNTYEVNAGYQYQLLINGIPAFQPHVVVERHEEVKAVDEEVKKVFLQVAKNTAEAAVANYLGGNMQFAKVATAIIEQGEKK